MGRVERFSLRQARRVALAAQGFADPLPPGRVDARHLRRVLGRTQLLQIDSVNVFARAHHLPAYSRLGAWPVELLDDMAFRRRELFEYWGHEASYLPVELHPLLRWRMERAARGEAGWSSLRSIQRDHPEYVASILEEVRQRGPVSARDLVGGPASGKGWWGWASQQHPEHEVGVERGTNGTGNATKRGLEYLFWSGRVTTSRRTNGFERLYDLSERVIPAGVLAIPTPTREDAQRELVRLSARAHGVATEKDLRDYFRLRPDEGRTAIQALVEEGELQPVTVEGWRGPSYLAASAARPRWVRRSALLSPFDPLVWERSRTERLWDVEYRIEIYVPAPKRVYGYYCLLFLHDEAIRARVDVKADRKDGVLRVLASWREGDAGGDAAEALAVELDRAARWQGLGEVVVELRGDLAPELRAAVARTAGPA